MPAKKRSTAQLEGFLKTVPIFSACSKRELRLIAGSGKEVDFEAGESICREGEIGIGMHVVLEGETKVMIGGRTRRRLGPGAFFGEIALLDGGPRTASVIAATPVKSLVIPAWNFKSILRRQPGLALKMLEEVCRRLRAEDALGD